jgi:ABC-type phosphate/phosphonate transport system permease subunit
MKRILSEKNLVVVLFVLVLITFAFAQEDTRKMERAYAGVNSSVTSYFVPSPNNKISQIVSESLAAPDLTK